MGRATASLTAANASMLMAMGTLICSTSQPSKVCSRNRARLEAMASRDAYLVMTTDEHEFDLIDPEVWHRAGFHADQFQHGEETNPGRRPAYTDDTWSLT